MDGRARSPGAPDAISNQRTYGVLCSGETSAPDRGRHDGIATHPRGWPVSPVKSIRREHVLVNQNLTLVFTNGRRRRVKVGVHDGGNWDMLNATPRDQRGEGLPYEIRVHGGVRGPEGRCQVHSAGCTNATIDSCFHVISVRVCAGVSRHDFGPCHRRGGCGGC